MHLTTTLKQNSLCPGDFGAKFTCVVTGTDLKWIIDNKPLQYNMYADEKELRFSLDLKDTSLLLHIWPIGNTTGYAQRVALLFVSLRPHATTVVNVKCQNGNSTDPEEVIFLPNVAPGILSMCLFVSWYSYSFFYVQILFLPRTFGAAVLMKNMQLCILLGKYLFLTIKKLTIS